ncbi:hypothetical protein N6H14_16910 [Paenibacillus sp. CC-CFT747]|nr:hypothetical protein N6H14_16910 [Paenibacillus sp. CC-CFT747]
MYPIHPVTVESCKPHYGRLVCAVMQDGTQHIGILSRVHGGKLYLNEDAKTISASTRSKGKGKAKAKSAALGPEGFPLLPDWTASTPASQRLWRKACS